MQEKMAKEYRVPQFALGGVVCQVRDGDRVENVVKQGLGSALAFWEKHTGLTWTAEIGSDGWYPAKQRARRVPA